MVSIPARPVSHNPGEGQLSLKRVTNKKATHFDKSKTTTPLSTQVRVPLTQWSSLAQSLGYGKKAPWLQPKHLCWDAFHNTWQSERFPSTWDLGHLDLESEIQHRLIQIMCFFCFVLFLFCFLEGSITGPHIKYFWVLQYFSYVKFTNAENRLHKVIIPYKRLALLRLCCSEAKYKPYKETEVQCHLFCSALSDAQE